MRIDDGDEHSQITRDTELHDLEFPATLITTNELEVPCGVQFVGGDIDRPLALEPDKLGENDLVIPIPQAVEGLREP
ncbi:MAG: hypothetical protein WKF80_06025 [Thermomicrobiales bacterium]